MATTDPVGTALWSIGAGSASGAVAITAAIFALRTLQARAGGTEQATLGAEVVLLGLVTGLTLAVGIGWARSRAIDDLWRRGVISALCLFGASLLALLTLPVDVVAGRVGLAGYASVLVGAAAFAWRVAGRAAAR